MHKFVEYSSSVMTIDFSRASGNDRSPIDARSTDGLQVTFSA